MVFGRSLVAHLAFFLLLLTVAPSILAAEEPPTPTGHPQSTPFAVIGYLPSYSIGRVQPAQLHGVTDLIYFSLEPKADGTLANPIIPKNAIEKLRAIQKVTKCRVLISVGGWRKSKGFAALAKSEIASERFIATLAAFCQREGFSGIDYDWEHPANAAESADFATLIARTRKALQPKQLQVTVAQAPWQNLGQAIYKNVDRIHLMSYDHAFPQATLEKSVADVKRLRGWGCPANKIALGIPFYGRNQKREAKTYRKLAGSPTFDAEKDLGDGFAYNGKKTTVAKTSYAIKQKLAGVMIWELSQDATGKSHSLLRAISDAVRRKGN